MELTNIMLPLTKNVCRTCLMESDTSMFMKVQDLIEHEMVKVKLIDVLVFLNCLENNDEENWPKGICSTCVSTALLSYNFKLNCLKATSTLSQILMTNSASNISRTDIDTIDVNVVYQDHEYDAPLFSNPSLEFENLPNNKVLTPLPPVTEITSAERPPRKEGEKKFSCSICTKAFTRVHGLKYHMTKHLGVRKYLCPKCGKRFHTPSGLAQHAITHKEVPQFNCGFCKKTYKFKQSLKEHFRVAHSSNCKLFSCMICDKKFTMKSTLSMHLKKHRGEKYACPHCPKTYTRATYLKAHIIVHTGQERPKPFQCVYQGCNRRFSYKHSLTIHVAHTHSTERAHKCEVCTKGFATASGLKAHKDCHNNSKELPCTICGTKFPNKKMLQKHYKLHDDEANNTVLDIDELTQDQVY